MVGDSFTYGQGIPTEDRLTEILQERLGGDPGRFEILNFGRKGTETFEHVETLKEAVLPAAPHFVLLQWFINDVEGDDKSGRPRGWRFLPSDFLRNRSALHYLVNRHWGSLQGRVGLSGVYSEYMIDRFGDPSSPDSLAAARAQEEFLELAKAAGAGVGMVLFPGLSADYADGDPQSYTLGFLMDRALETCRAFAVTCVDLRPTYAGTRPKQKLWANRLDSHPGRLANEMAAEAVLDAFRAQWVDAAGDLRSR